MLADDRPLFKWVKQNASRLVAEYPRPIEEHGLWIITKTYTTRRCAISFLNSKSSEIAIGLALDASGIATLSPESRWSKANGDVSSVMYEDDNGVVVFICGIYITKRWIVKDLRAEDRREKQEFLRSGEQKEPFTFPIVDPDGSEAELVLEQY